MLGTKLVGRYEILRNLGGGGFGETYVACDTQLPGSPECVVKKLKPLANDVETLQTARRLFDTEAQVLFKLGNHPQIPQLLAYFEDNSEFYLVQELIPGHDLSQEFTPGHAWNQQQVLGFLREILTVLDFVHRQNVIHRDINPHNIIRRDTANPPEQQLVLIDFGAVKQVTTTIVQSQIQPKARTVAIGTPGYMSAEQAQGNPRLSSDIYSVGVMAIQALTGMNGDELPRDDNTYEIAWHDTCKEQVDGGFANILDKMVRHDFRMRYGSAGEVLAEINNWMNGQTHNSTTLALAPAGGNPPILANAGNPSLTTKKQIPKKKIFLTLFSIFGLIIVGSVGAFYLFKSINTVNSQESYQQANTLYELNRYDDALRSYQQALDIRNDYPEAWHGKGKTLFALKRDREALGAYERAIQLAPDFTAAWGDRGLVLARLKRYKEAIAAFDKALATDAKNATIWNEKANSLSQLNQLEAAITAYDKAIEINGENPEFYYNKANILQKINRFDEAVNNYDKAVNLKSNYVNAWYQRGNVLYNLNRYQDALASYEKVVYQQPDFVMAWLAQGNIYMNQKRFLEAINAFEQVNKLNPNYYAVWYGKGWSLHQLQRYDEAIASYNRAIALRPNRHPAQYNLGNVLYQQQKYSAAITAYNRAIQADPNHPETWFSRGNAHFNLKQYTQAKADYERAIALKPDYQGAINARNQVDGLLKKGNEGVGNRE